MRNIPGVLGVAAGDRMNKCLVKTNKVELGELIEPADRWVVKAWKWRWRWWGSGLELDARSTYWWRFRCIRPPTERDCERSTHRQRARIQSETAVRPSPVHFHFRSSCMFSSEPNDTNVLIYAVCFLFLTINCHATWTNMWSGSHVLFVTLTCGSYLADPLWWLRF